MMRSSMFAMALLLASPALAASGVSLSSNVLVEKTSTVGGRAHTELSVPRVVTPGDLLLFSSSYHNEGAKAATNFVVTNPVPANVGYVGSDTPGTQVSVDGGRSWGALAGLRVPVSAGVTRAATAQDVTHVRWTFASIPAGAAGKVTFRGIVH